MGPYLLPTVNQFTLSLLASMLRVIKCSMLSIYRLLGFLLSIVANYKGEGGGGVGA